MSVILFLHLNAPVILLVLCFAGFSLLAATRHYRGEIVMKLAFILVIIAMVSGLSLR